MSIDRLESFELNVHGKLIAGISTPEGGMKESEVSGMVGLKKGVVMLTKEVVKGSRRLRIPHLIKLGHTFSKD